MLLGALSLNMEQLWSYATHVMFLSGHAISLLSRLSPVELGSGALLLNTWHGWCRTPRIRAWVCTKK